MAPLLDRYLNETLKSSPLVFYRMHEGTGTTMLDYSSNANNGTYNGSGVAWVPAAISTPYTAASGKESPLFNSQFTTLNYSQTPATTTPSYNALLDGAAGRATATLGTINTSAASKVTVEMWVKWDGIQSGTNGTFEALANFGGATGLLLGFLKNVAASDWRFGLSVRNTGDLWGLSNATTLAAFTRDVYHHVVFVIVNNAVQTSKLYIDGVQYTMTQQVGTSTTTDSVTSALAIGYDGTASFFGGFISEFAVYNGEPFDATVVKNRYHIGAYGGEYNEVATLPGIESRIELAGDVFNNFVVINNKSNPAAGNRTRTLDQYYITELGGMDNPDFRFSEESNFYRDGMNPLQSRYGGRTITMTGYVEASNFKSLRQLTSKLKKGLSPNNPSSGVVEFPVIFRNIWDNGFDFYLNARQNTAFQMREAQTSYSAKRDFLITLRSSQPFFESVGSRTEILTVGASVMLPNKGNFISYPIITFWGPFTDARLNIGSNTLIMTGSVSASTSIVVDCKNKTCSDWTKFNTTGDFPYINSQVLSDTFQNYASFMSVVGSTLGVTRCEINWRHSII